MSSVRISLKQNISKFLQHKTAILWIIAIILVIIFIIYVIKKADLATHSFASYYTASKLLSEGENVSQFYNDDWFRSKVDKYVPGVQEIYHVNLPTATLMIIPLSSLDYTSARIAWTAFNFILLFISIGLLIKNFKFSKEKVPLVIILFLFFQPLHANFAYAQAYVLIFFLLVFAWYAYKSNKDELLGSLIGLMFVLKTAGALFFILLLINKRWKALIWSAATIIFFILISLPLVGIDSWFAYVDKILSYTSRPELSVTGYQTIYSFFYHFTSFEPKWNPYPLIDIPFLGKMLTIIFSIIILASVSFYAYRMKNPYCPAGRSDLSSVKKPDVAFAVFIIAGVILNPASLDYHYIVLLLPFLILIEMLHKHHSKMLWILLIIFYVMIAERLLYASPKLAGGWLAIFAYPKLYGALGLWGLSLRASYLSKSSNDCVQSSDK
jgi:hypothetical protein